MDSTDGESSVREEAEEDSGKRSEMAGMRSEMQRDAEVPTGTLSSMWEHTSRMEAKTKKIRKWNDEPPANLTGVIGDNFYSGITVDEAIELLEEERERGATVRDGAFLDWHDKLLKEKRKEAMANTNKEAGKAEASVTESGRPEESLTETGRQEEFATKTSSPEESVTKFGKADESLTVGSGQFGMDEELMGKETNSIQIPAPQIYPDADPSATKSIQYHDIDPMQKDADSDPMHKEADTDTMQKEAEEIARLIRMVSSGDESLVHKEAEESGKRSEMVGMRSGMQRHAVELMGRMKFVGNTPEFVEQLMEQHAAPLTEAWGPEESVTEMDEVGRGKSALEGSKPFIERGMSHIPMVDTEFKSEMEAETGKAEEAVVDMNLAGGNWVEVKMTDYRLELQGIKAQFEALKASVASKEKLAKEGARVNARAKARLKARAKARAKAKAKAKAQQLLNDMSHKFNISLSSMPAVEEHTPMVELDKLFTKPADPTATNSISTLGLFSVQDDLDHERGKSATPYAKKKATEEEDFASYSRDWESAWSKTHCVFQDITVLSSMQFTHYTPGLIARSSAGCTPETLQVLSIKFTEIAGGLELPLSVYGVVAARDIVDRNRNILFSCDRSDAQELKQNDPFLRLMGPSRAIVFTDKVDFEIELKVKDALDSQDKALISCARRYMGGDGTGVSTICFKNVLCTLELCLQPVTKTVQATILGVCVVKKDGSWPFQHGGLVACSPLSGEYVFTHRGVSRTIEPSSIQIVLLESKDRAMPKGCGAYVHLSRKVVSVEIEGALDFVIKAYSESGVIANEGHVRFVAKNCNISQKKCALGDAEVIITVAWSLVATSKSALSSEVCNRTRVV